MTDPHISHKPAAGLGEEFDLIQHRLEVIGGTGYRGARKKLHETLRALAVHEVDLIVAVSDFSQLYRVLPAGHSLEISLTVTAGLAKLDIQAELNEETVSRLIPTLGNVRGRIHCIDSQKGSSRLEWRQEFELESTPDIAEARVLLHNDNTEELLLQASQTAAALSSTRSRLSSFQEDLHIASDIQQRMLVSKTRLGSVCPALDCHACMVPCREIGGDFYDLIPLDSDHVAVVVGDVSGKGIPAALMMATCITLLRAYTESFRSASRIMRKVNARLINGNELDCMFTTLFLGILNLHRNSITYCNAGHNPAVLRSADKSIRLLDDIHGPAVGVIDGVEYEETRVPFSVGDRLLLYTDGASERFGRDGSMFGEERIIAHCSNSPICTSSKDLVSDLLRKINQFGNADHPHDDVTVVCIKRLADPKLDLGSLHEERLANHRGMAELMECVEDFCQTHAIESEIIGRLHLVLDELMMNVVSYGGSEDGRLPSMSLSMRLQSTLLVVELRDTGKPFNPFALAEPDTDLSLEERDPGGLGVFLVRSLAQSFSYNYEEPHNCVQLEINCHNARAIDNQILDQGTTDARRRKAQ